MENDRGFHGSKENLDCNNSRNNTEYLPTRCRITKPAPPKPATNPMQFVKFSPSKLLSTAKEQIKKAEEVKVVSSKIRDDAEDWQANLDNWKSCRRKRQEHIIERVVEVKKFEQQDSERTRRKSKTFHEILEEKGKRRTKLSIPIYEDDDNNDLSDLGLGNNSNVKSSESNSQVDENETLQSESESTNTETKDNNENQWQTTEVNSTFDTVTSSSTTSETIAENQRKSESKTICENINNFYNKYTESNSYKIESNCKTSLTYNLTNENKKSDFTDVSKNKNGGNGGQEQQYTYESAIQDYRTRVKSNLNSNITPPFGRSEDHSSDDQETNMIVQKGSILKKKELFESDKMFEINSYESTSSKRVQNDFVNSQSLKERLISLEKCGAATITTTIPTPPVTTKELPQQISVSDDTSAKNRSTMLESIKSDLEKSRNKWRESSIASTSVTNSEWNGNEDSDRPASPDTNMFVDKIEKFRNSLDKLGSNCEVPGNRQDDLSYDPYNKQPMDFESYNKEPIDFTFNKEGPDYCPPNYLAFSSPVESDLLTGNSQYCDTDREDSGIHTADVSCSVSQADEPVEDTDLNINTKFEGSEHMETSDKYSECSLDATSAIRPTVVWPPVDNRPSYPVVDYGFPVDGFPLGPPPVPLEPPKEKPPPPPKPTADDDIEDDSTARIKKEIRLKRSSFLGISSDLFDSELASNIVPKVPPTDVTSFIPLENALNRQQQLFRGAHGSFSEAGDSQDSGVEMDRAGNQVSTPDGWSSGISDFEQSQQNTPINKVYPETGIRYEEEIVKKEKEIIALVEQEEQWRVGTNKHQYRKRDLTKSYSAPKLDLLDHPISLFNESTRSDISRNDDDHFEMMQVKRELLQLEQEASLKRQKEAIRMNKAEEVIHNSNDRFSNKRLSLEDITNSGMNHPSQSHEGDPDYRKSMPELQYNNSMFMNTYNVCVDNANQVHKSLVRPLRPKLPEQYDSNRPTIMGHVGSSADAPRLRPRSQGDLKNYNQHWLIQVRNTPIQEAEQRRISNQMYQSSTGMRCDSWKLTKPDKHLPDSVIQTLTNRLQKKLLMPQPHQRIDNLPVYNPHHPVPGQLHHSQLMEESQDKMLSVSGKKKCSYCENELGRGAAMIIESLCLFYHMECFKCCVCHVQLGDGRMGTDVRVRNSKLHCHNCYSSDDGVKFSCV